MLEIKYLTNGNRTDTEKADIKQKRTLPKLRKQSKGEKIKNEHG